MDFSRLDDAALMEWIARANTGALGDLYDRYGRLVFSVAIHIVGDAETAEEITQDVFVRVWEGAKTYRPDLSKVSSWLVSITRYRSIDELRRRGARPEKEQTDWPEDLGLEHLPGLPVLDSPEQTVDQAIQQQGIHQAIFSLPREQREVLSLAFFKGLSHSQIAEQLGEPLGTVKSRVRLAMHKLRDMLVQNGVVDP